MCALADFVGIDITGIPELTAKLDKLYPEAADSGVENVDTYLVNTLRQYPPYSYVPLAQVGGFVSEKQRRFVMAAISDGRITPGRPNRSQRLARGWHKEGEGRKQIIVNEVEYAAYEHEPANQTQMHMLQGWEIIPEFIHNRMDEIIRRFDAGVKNGIKKLGLS